MRLLILSLIASLLAAAVHAAATAPGQASPAGVYQQYKPLPKPTPVVKDDAVRVSLHQPSAGIQLKIGAAAPFGDTALYYEAGPAFGADILYYASRDVALDVFVLYSMQKFKAQPNLPVPTQPMTNLGMGAKLVYSFREIERVTPYFGAGLGFFLNNRPKPLTKVVNNVAMIYDFKQDSSTAFGLTGAFGGAYAMNEHLKAGLDIAIYSVSLGGGTSDNLLFAIPSLSLTYNF